MSSLSHCNPTGRFTGLADRYAKYRPSYPTAALDWLVTRCKLTPSSLLVDVGCGTGISSRLFAARGIPVLGIEPNQDMLSRAAAEPLPPGSPPPAYRVGRAEQTDLPDSIADAVLAAQAFHWFDTDAALREFHRLLKPGGWVILMWNERDDSDPFTAAYGAIIRTAPNAAAIEVPRGRAGDPLLSSNLFQDRERVVFANEQELDEEGVLGRAFSASYAPQEPEQIAAWETALQALFARNQKEGKVILRYVTSIYLGRRDARK
jgi:SAM-dependent methyltransferase